MDLRHPQNKNDYGGTIFFDDAHARLTAHHDLSQRLLCILRDGRRADVFCTEDSKKYVTPRQRRSVHPVMDARGRFDAVHPRYVIPAQHRDFGNLATAATRSLWGPLRALWGSRTGWSFGLSPVRAWNLSLVGAMIFGMFAMTMLYRSFGTAAHATEVTAHPVHEGVAAQTGLAADAWALAARNATTSLDTAAATIAVARSEEAVTKDAPQLAFEQRAREMVAGYPIEAMLPEIFKLDRTTAAYMIAMAKQESQWGKRVPVLAGKDCYNYWGFRAVRPRMGTGGHTCFDNIEDAVTTVGARVHELVHEYGRNTAEELIVWKCGYSCEGHDPSNVRAWKRTVGTYYDALMQS